MQVHFTFRRMRGNKEEEEKFSKAMEVAERKIGMLKKYFARNQETTQVYVDLGKVSGAHQNGEIWRAQLSLNSRGKPYNASTVAATIEQAVGAAVAELEVTLRKAKRRNESLLRRGGNAFKAFMRRFQTE